MPFYDNFLNRGQGITFFGKKIIASEIANRLMLIDQFCSGRVQKVLEFGPGKGHFAEAISELQWEYIGVDASPAIIKSLRSSGILEARSRMLWGDEPLSTNSINSLRFCKFDEARLSRQEKVSVAPL